MANISKYVEEAEGVRTPVAIEYAFISPITKALMKWFLGIG